MNNWVYDMIRFLSYHTPYLFRFINPPNSNAIIAQTVMIYAQKDEESEYHYELKNKKYIEKRKL